MSVGSPNLIKFSFSNLQHEPERARDAVSDLAWVPVCVHHLHSWQSVGQGRAMQSSKIGTTKPLCNEYGCQTKVETCEIPVCSVAETVHITARARSLMRMAAQTPALHSAAQLGRWRWRTQAQAAPSVPEPTPCQTATAHHPTDSGVTERWGAQAVQQR
jgi:hypothetical protein